MQSVKWVFITIVLLKSTILFSQTISDRDELSQRIGKILINNFSSKKCPNVDLFFSNIIVSFDRNGLVKSVELYGLPSCVSIDTTTLTTQIKEGLSANNKLFKEYRKNYILLPILFIREEKPLNAAEVKQEWLKIFSGTPQINPKKLKHVIPYTIQLYDPIR